MDANGTWQKKNREKTASPQIKREKEWKNSSAIIYFMKHPEIDENKSERDRISSTKQLTKNLNF